MPKTPLLQRLNSKFEAAPVVERNSNVFTSQDYMLAANIRRSAAQERINELVRRNDVRRVMIKTAEGLRRAYEYIGSE